MPPSSGFAHFVVGRARWAIDIPGQLHEGAGHPGPGQAITRIKGDRAGPIRMAQECEERLEQVKKDLGFFHGTGLTFVSIKIRNFLVGGFNPSEKC